MLSTRWWLASIVKLLDKLLTKLAGEEAPQNASSPKQALEALNHLPDQEQVKVLDYIKAVQSLKMDNVQ